MPARDREHAVVKDALVKDGLTITHDPLFLPVGRRDLFADLGAQKLIAAERGPVKIAAKVKGFSGPSEMRLLEQAVGQYVLYEHALSVIEPDRKLYLAVSQKVYNEIFRGEEIGRILLDSGTVRLFTYDANRREIVTWTEPPDTAMSSNPS